MMRRLSEHELSREPARPLAERPATARDPLRAAALLHHVERVFESMQRQPSEPESLRAQLEHAIALGLRGES